MREQSISQSPYGYTVTLKCDRAYLYDVRDANTHYIRLYEGCEIYPGEEKIYGAAKRFSLDVERKPLICKLRKFVTEIFPSDFFELLVINDIIILRYNCLNKKRCLSIFIYV